MEGSENQRDYWLAGAWEVVEGESVGMLPSPSVARSAAVVTPLVRQLGQAFRPLVIQASTQG